MSLKVQPACIETEGFQKITKPNNNKTLGHENLFLPIGGNNPFSHQKKKKRKALAEHSTQVVEISLRKQHQAKKHS